MYARAICEDDREGKATVVERIQRSSVVAAEECIALSNRLTGSFRGRAYYLGRDFDEVKWKIVLDEEGAVCLVKVVS
jgi:hypothetical protein